MRPKLGLTGRHLVDIFSVTKSTVSRLYLTWSYFLALTVKESLLRWPLKEKVRVHMPSSFSRYPDTRIIIECTDFFIEKPSSPSAQKATWSDYKHHNHCKTLSWENTIRDFLFCFKVMDKGCKWSTCNPRKWA